MPAAASAAFTKPRALATYPGKECRGLPRCGIQAQAPQARRKVRLAKQPCPTYADVTGLAATTPNTDGYGEIKSG